ncbi:hypothetical protein ACEWY4_010446 [Coilia grayii]|uniref:Integrase catalytic domain-containing protein n=1 Tax=Coilia grayii TaxID=363190 RepID=A0ABD1K1Z2_9TELE
MDLVGKVTPTKAGNQYICVIIDYYTKWAEAFPLPSKQADVVAECIVKFFYKFGAPKRILTNNGTEFVNEVDSTVEDILSNEIVSQGIALRDGLKNIIERNVQQKQARRKRGKACQYHIGQTVVRKNIRSEQRKGEKLGPFRIVAIQDKSVDLEDEQGNITPRINIDHLKPFTVESPYVPHKFHLHSSPIPYPAHTPSSPPHSPLDLSVDLSLRNPPTISTPPPDPISSTPDPVPSPPPQDPVSSPPPQDPVPSLPPLVTTPVDAIASPPSQEAMTTTPSLDPSQIHSCVQAAWDDGRTSHVLLSKVGPYKVFYQDLYQLGPGKEVESESPDEEEGFKCYPVEMRDDSTPSSKRLHILWRVRSENDLGSRCHYCGELDPIDDLNMAEIPWVNTTTYD